MKAIGYMIFMIAGIIIGYKLGHAVNDGLAVPFAVTGWLAGLVAAFRVVDAAEWRKTHGKK